ncbi:MAG: hypothetical protein Q9212_001593 [Teloschistes hypoglaucus]
MDPAILKKKFAAYIKAFNTHDTSSFGQFYAEDFSVHLPGFPRTKNRAETLALFEGGLAFFVATIHPTWLSFGERSVAMEAQMHSEVMQDAPFVFPFTGKTYKAGDKFVYPAIVHYEYNDDYLLTTFRGFSEVLQPDPGCGITKDILPGWEYVGDRKVNNWRIESKSSE